MIGKTYSFDSSNQHNLISEVGKMHRAYFKSLPVAKSFRSACERVGHRLSWVSPRPHGWVVHWA